MKKFLEKNSIWVLIFVFGVLYIVWSIKRHLFFETDAIDLGIFDQYIWHYSRFEAPTSSVKFSTYPGPNILGDHFSPVLALLAPFFWIWKDPLVLLIAQAVAVVIGAYPIYKLAKLKLNNQMFSLAVSFAYLGFVGVQTLLDYDFHEVAFGLPLLAFALLFLHLKKYTWYFFLIIFSLFIKEDMPLFVASLGLYAIIRLREFKVGISTVGIGAISYYLITYLIIPYFKKEPFAYEHLDPALGKTGFDLIIKTFTDPILVIKSAFYDAQFVKLRTTLNLLASFSFLPLLSPETLILTAPNVAERFITYLPQRWIIRFQYSAILSPIFAVASIHAVENFFWITKKLNIKETARKNLLYLLSFALVISTIYITFRNNAPFTRILNPASYCCLSNFSKDYEILKLIPKDASVMAQSSLVPHLSHRDKIFRYDDSIFTRGIFPEYIIMDVNLHSDPPYLRSDLQKRIEDLRKHSNYEELYWDNERLLLKLK